MIDIWVYLTFALIAVFLFLGVPLVVSIGIGSMILIKLTGVYPMDILGQLPFSALDKWALLAMPLFILTGDIISRGSIAMQLTNLADKILGMIRGGLGHTTLIACAFFAGICGSNSSDTAAIGRIMIPSLRKEGYALPYSAALAAAGGSVGIIIPPSIILIVYGMATSTSVGALFIAGIFPGLLLTFSMCCANYLICWKNGYGSTENKHFSLKELLKALYYARYGLGGPFIILGGIYGGIFTPTEAAGVAAAYCLFAELFLNRSIKFRDIPNMMLRSAVLSSMIACLIFSALLFAEIIGLLRIPENGASFLLDSLEHPLLIILCIFGVLLIAGLLLETIASILILMPVLLPIAIELGFHPVHFGIWVCCALAIGFITPPVGVNLFVAAGLTGDSLTSIARYAIPFVISMIVALLFIIFIPELSIWFL